MTKPQFNLALARDGETIGYRGTALLDTGFDGYIVINREIVNFLKPTFTKKIALNIGNNQKVMAVVCDIYVIFETLTQDYSFGVEAIYMPSELQPIIGSRLIQEICVNENTNLIFDYLGKKLSFETR